MSPSIWWPTPTRPSTWFSAEELAASRAYNRPLLRAAEVRLGLRIVLLAAAHFLLVGGLSPDRQAYAVLVIAVPLVAFAWWLPGAVVDTWFEFVHEPKFGHESLPGHRFAVGSMASLVSVIAVLGVGSGCGYWLMARTPIWSVVLAAVSLLVFLVLARLDLAARSLGGNLRGLDGPPVVALANVAKAAGLDGVQFATMDSEVLPGLNALSTRQRGQPQIVVSGQLLEAAPELLTHVVAHELAHLRHRHLSRTLWLTAFSITAVTVILGPFARWGVPFRALGISRPDDPRGLVIFIGLVALMVGVFAPALAWFGRANERKADAVAFDLAGGLPLPILRSLHVTHRSNLDPGLIPRLVAAHPPPAERLDRASRVTSNGIPSKV